MEDLLAEQSSIMQSINRALDNFKKIGKANYTLAKIRNRLTNLKETFEKCRRLDAQIHRLTDSDERKKLSYFKDNHFLVCEENFNTTSDYMAEWLEQLDPQQLSIASDVSQNQVDHPGKAGLHLPRISLPTFSGAYEEWESFRDRFKSIVLENKDLSNVSRMHYLCLCLKGDARNLLRNYAITDANFEAAWELIIARYENKRRLVNTHLQTLHNLPDVKFESSSDLCLLRDKVNMAIKALRNLDRPVDTWNDMLVYLVVHRLDKTTRKAWELKLGDSADYSSYSELEQFLETRIRALEALSPSPSRPARLASVQTHTANTTHREKCPLCRGIHFLGHCPDFQSKTPHQRYTSVKQYNLCVNCLSSKHKTKTCPSKRTCNTCQQTHHTLLHFEAKPNDSVEETSKPSATVTTTPQITTHLLLNTGAPQYQVLLVTAWVQVTSTSGRCENVRALLDQGSVATLMTERLAQRLRVARKRISVSISSDKRTESRHSASIRIAPCNKTGPVYPVDALILKKLTKYIPNRSSHVLAWPHLRELPLADPDPTSPHPIDLILGADLYGCVLLDGVHPGSISTPHSGADSRKAG